MTQWPASIQLNVFEYDDYFYGDPRGNEVAQRLPPNSLGRYLLLYVLILKYPTIST
jgi:hypothetical protein